MRSKMKTLLRKIKFRLKRLLRKDVSFKTDMTIPTERLGSDYGGWVIRNGSVSRDSVVYSFGVGEDASFDLELIEKYGATIHAFDPTPRSIQWAKKNVTAPQFVMHEYGVADFDGEIQFNPPENPEHVSHTILDRNTSAHAISVPVKRLKTIMDELGHTHIDMLKMDIEGAEYGVVEDLIRVGIFPQQILIEYHHRFPNVGAAKTADSIKRLRKAGYRLFSI